MSILFVQTGGTIDKDYPKQTKGWGFEITTPAVERILSKLKLSIEYQVISLFKKDSMDISDVDRTALRQFLMASEYNKIIITHGTDTIIKTAQFMQQIKGKTIVFTGAFLPEKFKTTDADFNLGMAVATAQNFDQGVFICLNGLVCSPKNITRDMETGKYFCK